jgi:hypothetical protein
MLDFLTAPANLPFAVSLGVMLVIALLEGVTTVLGAGASALLESVMPDFDADVGMDVAAGAGADGAASGAAEAHLTAGHGPLTSALGWLRIGELPVLILLVVLLTTFGLAGLGVQMASVELTGRLVPGSLAWLPALAVGLPIFRFTSGWLARLLPKDETTAVSQATFIGRVAVIVRGTARSGEPAEARLRDEHGRTHYVLVEPHAPDETFQAGAPVLLVAIGRARFKVVRPPRELLPEPPPD